MLERVIQQIRDSDTLSRTGKIENIIGMSIEASGGRGAMGDICRIYSAESNSQVLAEVVGFKNEHMPVSYTHLNIDLVKEISDAMAATQAFSANVTAFNTLKTVASRALEIGK